MSSMNPVGLHDNVTYQEVELLLCNNSSKGRTHVFSEIRKLALEAKKRKNENAINQSIDRINQSINRKTEKAKNWKNQKAKKTKTQKLLIKKISEKMPYGARPLGLRS